MCATVMLSTKDFEKANAVQSAYSAVTDTTQVQELKALR